MMICIWVLKHARVIIVANSVYSVSENEMFRFNTRIQLGKQTKVPHCPNIYNRKIVETKV